MTKMGVAGFAAGTAVSFLVLWYVLRNFGQGEWADHAALLAIGAIAVYHAGTLTARFLTKRTLR